MLCQSDPSNLIYSEQVTCLLLLRGDLSKSEAREKATEYVSNTGGGDGVRVKSILSQVTVFIMQCPLTI